MLLNKRRLIAMLTLSGLWLPAFAAQGVMPPTMPNSKATIVTTTSAAEQNTTAMTTLLNNMFQWVNQVGQAKNPLSLPSFEQYFTPNASYISNGATIATNRLALYKHFEWLRHNQRKIKVELPLKEVFVGGDKTVIYYIIHITLPNGQHRQAYSMAILTFEHGKIANWVAVDGYHSYQKH